MPDILSSTTSLDWAATAANSGSATASALEADAKPVVCKAVIAGDMESGGAEGRYLVANEDLAAGETIFCDNPLVAGPIYTRSRPSCLQCLKFATATSSRCSSCGFPVCDTVCEQGLRHAAECRVFSAAGFRLEITDPNAMSPIYSCITILRCLLLRDTDPAGWSVFSSLMDHDAERTEKDSAAWKVHEAIVVSFVTKALKLGERFGQREIRRVIGILRTNSVKLESQAGHCDGVAVYPTYSFANHSCLCNSQTKKHKSEWKLELKALRDIKKGETIWTRYTTPQLGNFQRVMDIQRTWHFTCTCARCTDPSEFGTMLCGVKCGQSCDGTLLQKLPTMIGSPWSCDKCKRTVGVTTINAIMKGVTEDIRKNREEDNDKLEALICRHSGVTLHPNHYLLLGVKEIVLQRIMMSVNNKQAFKDLPQEEKSKLLALQTKLFCEIAEILQKVDSPGAPWSEKMEKMKKDEVKLRKEFKV